MDMEFTPIIGLILGIIGLSIFFVLILPFFSPTACDFRLRINSMLSIYLKNFFSGIPSFIASSGGFFGNSFYRITDGWSPCVMNMENPSADDLATTLTYNSLLCWEVFGSGEKDYLVGEPPLIECYRYMQEFDEFELIGLKMVMDWGLDSDVDTSFNRSRAQVIFIQQDPDDPDEKAKFVDFTENPKITGKATTTVYFLDWNTYSIYGTFSEMKNQNYIPSGERQNIAESIWQNGPHINAATPPREWDCGGTCYWPISPDKWCDKGCDEQDVSRTDVCFEVKSDYDSEQECIDGFYDWLYDSYSMEDYKCFPLSYAPEPFFVGTETQCDPYNSDQNRKAYYEAYTGCGYLTNEMVCCGDKIVVCISNVESGET